VLGVEEGDEKAAGWERHARVIGTDLAVPARWLWQTSVHGH
jgi:hypothetical protein